MAHVEGFPDKDGLKKLVIVAKALCTTVAAFSALWLKKYPDNELIAALLVAVAGVCALIPEVESEFIEFEGNNDPILADPTTIPGINPSLLPAEDPDFV